MASFYLGLKIILTMLFMWVGVLIVLPALIVGDIIYSLVAITLQRLKSTEGFVVKDVVHGLLSGSQLYSRRSAGTSSRGAEYDNDS